MNLYWLSFVDPDKSDPPESQHPGGPGFLGVSIVEAEPEVHAVMMAWRHGCNPGGEVGIWELPEAAREAVSGSLNRLLTQEEAEAL